MMALPTGCHGKDEVDERMVRRKTWLKGGKWKHNTVAQRHLIAEIVTSQVYPGLLGGMMVMLCGNSLQTRLLFQSFVYRGK